VRLRGSKDNEGRLCTTQDAACFLPRLKGGAAADTEKGESEVSAERVDREKDRGRDAAAAIDAAVKVKEKGNSVFAQGDVAAAMMLYTQAYEMLSCVEPATEEVAYAREQIEMACLVNKAQAATTLGQYQEAVSCCSLALEIDNRNVRAYHRRAVALAGNTHTHTHTHTHTFMYMV